MEKEIKCEQVGENIMGKIEDVIGKRFGRLLVIERTNNNGKRKMYLCKCDCGKEIITSGTLLRTGKSTSCGCYRTERTKETNTTHGCKNTRLYRIWTSMRNRCYYSKSINYSNYGGRGITVCDEWRNDFQAFYDWAMANGYSNTLTIDRINNDGNYEPNNCRWITTQEQSNNKTTNHFVEYNGEVLTIAQLVKRYSINKSTLWYRLKYGWSVEKAVATPIRAKKGVRA